MCTISKLLSALMLHLLWTASSVSAQSSLAVLLPSSFPPFLMICASTGRCTQPSALRCWGKAMLFVSSPQLKRRSFLSPANCQNKTAEYASLWKKELYWDIIVYHTPGKKKSRKKVLATHYWSLLQTPLIHEACKAQASIHHLHNHSSFSLLKSQQLT